MITACLWLVFSPTTAERSPALMPGYGSDPNSAKQFSLPGGKRQVLKFKPANDLVSLFAVILVVVLVRIDSNNRRLSKSVDADLHLVKNQLSNVLDKDKNGVQDIMTQLDGIVARLVTWEESTAEANGNGTRPGHGRDG